MGESKRILEDKIGAELLFFDGVCDKFVLLVLGFFSFSRFFYVK